MNLFQINANESECLLKLHGLDYLQDYSLTVPLAKQALIDYPQSSQIVSQTIKIFAHAGLEEEMIRTYKNFCSAFPDSKDNRDLLEEICWGMIQKGSLSTAPINRAISLIAAAMGNDARGITILVKHFNDPNLLVRGLAVEFSSHFRDTPLQDAVIHRLGVENDMQVRLNLIRSVGKMHIRSAIPFLLKILENDRTIAEEKVAAIESLVTLEEEISRQDLFQFTIHPRGGLRALSAAIIAHDERIEDLDLLLPLLHDPLPDVRKQVLETFSELRPKEIANQSILTLIQPLVHDSSYEVALMAIFVKMLYASQEAQKEMEPWFKSISADERLFAAAALAGAGRYGFPLTVTQFYATKDPYVRVNLGQAMINHRIYPLDGGDAIYRFLQQTTEKIMSKEVGNFSMIAPSDVFHKPDVPNYPEIVNQTVRLDLLNQLSLIQHPQAMQAITTFLRGKPWGVSGSAAALLLTEGDESALALIRQLLSDPSEKIQLQAALILGLWGSDPVALTTLEKLYSKVTKNQKEQILEALGRIGEESSIPFLVKRLEESQQTLRLIAATALLQTLYH